VVVDVGAGSGVIGVTFALERPDCKVFGVDIDPEALKVAKVNTKKQRARVRYYVSHYLDDLPLSKIDYVIADLPYGSPDSMLISNTLGDLKLMPPVSVFHPDGTLNAYKELVDSARHRKFKCNILCETGLLPKKEIKRIFKEYNFSIHSSKNYSITEIKI
jgi:release factor glutamine methyltransferase